jgi:hypothetical protein
MELPAGNSRAVICGTSIAGSTTGAAFAASMSTREIGSAVTGAE